MVRWLVSALISSSGGCNEAACSSLDALAVLELQLRKKEQADD
jgi:hypothetical protein